MSEEQKPSIVGTLKKKLIDSKEKWARDGRLLTGTQDPEMKDRLPPGQRLVTNWPVLDLGIQPQIAADAWEMTIGGLVENPLKWSFEDFRAQPQVEMVSDIHCVTAWSRYDNHWEGVSTAHILSVVKPKPEATHVLFESYDGYTTNVRLDVFSEPNALLVHSWEGKPLTKEHGAPVRVIIPSWYFWKSPKWLKRIVFAPKDKPGFWEVRGYHNDGDPWREQRYDTDT